MDTTPRSQHSTGTLEVKRATGLWRIASAGSTEYYLDLDDHRVVRARGSGSGRFPFDNQWTSLIDVICNDIDTGIPEPDVIRIGGRPRYRFDPDPSWPDVEWRLQRIVTVIERITGADAAAIRARFTSASLPGPLAS
ncbi:hypothetical protein [Cellulomonas sp. NPDC058312]|uniref:hypothetical protein n=1 Tax=Cellulomonas sp. NPDC058312 TaxID=3346441 RepID=UPI0036E7617D